MVGPLPACQGFLMGHGMWVHLQAHPFEHGAHFPKSHTVRDCSTAQLNLSPQGAIRRGLRKEKSASEDPSEQLEWGRGVSNTNLYKQTVQEIFGEEKSKWLNLHRSSICSSKIHTLERDIPVFKACL